MRPGVVGRQRRLEPLRAIPDPRHHHGHLLIGEVDGASLLPPAHHVGLGIMPSVAEPGNRGDLGLQRLLHRAEAEGDQGLDEAT
jgi:hypothetical protein